MEKNVDSFCVEFHGRQIENKFSEMKKWPLSEKTALKLLKRIPDNNSRDNQR